MAKAKHLNCCRSCRHFDLPAVLNRVGAVMANTTARCLWTPPEPLNLKLPESVTQYHSAQQAIDTLSNKHQVRRGPNDGATCPCWELRVEEVQS